MSKNEKKKKTLDPTSNQHKHTERDKLWNRILGTKRKICVIIYSFDAHRRHDDDGDGVWTAIKLREERKCCETIKEIWCGYISPNHSIAISDCWMFGFYRRGVTERLPAPPLCWTFSHISPVLFYHWPHDSTFSGWCLALFSLNSYFLLSSMWIPFTINTSLVTHLFAKIFFCWFFWVFCFSVFIKPPSLCQIEFQHICAA